MYTCYLAETLISNHHTHHTGWVKKSMISGVWCKIVPFLCDSLIWYLFNIFFWYSMVKKNPPNFFSRIKESQKICKIKLNQPLLEVPLLVSWINQVQGGIDGTAFVLQEVFSLGSIQPTALRVGSTKNYWNTRTPTWWPTISNAP